MNHYDVVVIGAGQAGLAIGYHLAQQGRRFTILEAADAPATAWRNRWDSLKLFTPARHCNLPGLPFPGGPDHYATRDEVVAYLTEYASRFELPVEYDSPVRAVRRHGDSYSVMLDYRVYVADQVIVATGPFQTPRTPALADQLDSSVTQLHSSAYRNPEAIPAGPVLVVGGGNTGYQIAEELSATYEVHLSVGGRQTPLPQRVFGRDIFAYLVATGLMGKTRDSRLGRLLREREALIGSNPRAARRLRIHLHGRTAAAEGTTVRFENGTQVEVATVIWATGFGLDHSWIDAPIFDADGNLEHERGVTGSPGLYFLGLPWQHTRGSALLGWVKDDAAYLATQIEARADSAVRGTAVPLAA